MKEARSAWMHPLRRRVLFSGFYSHKGESLLPSAVALGPFWVLVYLFTGHCQRKVARAEFSTDDRELGRPELTPLGERGGAVELEIVS